MRKPSTFICNAAEALSCALAQKYSIEDAKLNEFLQLELFKIITDYSQYFFNTKENLELTEFELLLVKHKNKQAFLSAFCERTGQDTKIGEKMYDKVRQKLN